MQIAKPLGAKRLGPVGVGDWEVSYQNLAPVSIENGSGEAGKALGPKGMKP